jgi:sterol desaturase/sphingolipid hydroxylase (fatty acid hydroxylase superfamily)
MNDSVKSSPADPSIRLFRNDFLESLTHVHPIVPLLFWSPVAAWLLWRSVTVGGVDAGGIALCALAGALVWSLSEYLLHRFVFHFPATSRLGQWLVFMFHGVHHDAPRDKTRLVMPPAGAVIIMSMLWVLFGLVVPAPWLEPFVAFFILSYLCYDYIHYATHHFPMRHPLLHFLKVYHLQHHYGAKGLRYGVSSPLWDRVFGTYPTPAQSRAGD